MNAKIAALMDEVGLRILIEEYVGTVHYYPEPGRLSHYCSTSRQRDPRVFCPAPPECVLEKSDAMPHAGHDRVTFRFPSPVSTPFLEDSVVRGILYLTHHRPVHGTVIVSHGGFTGVQPQGADLHPYLRWAVELNRHGLNVAFPSLPRHLDRRPAGTFSGERFLSGNMLETIDAISQGAVEMEMLARSLVAEGLGPVGIMGYSMGGLTATQTVAISRDISAALLLAPVPDAASCIFDSYFGRTIKADWLAGGCSRQDLEEVFYPLSPACRSPFNPDLPVRLASGIHDTVVLPHLVKDMADRWQTETWDLPEGHLGIIASHQLRVQGSQWFAETFATGPRSL